MPSSGRPADLPTSRRPASGQSVVEFAIILPVILLLLIAIADLGRLYTSAVAVESAAREAADFGAFDASYWDDVGLNYVTTTDEMRRRACIAAAGSHLPDLAMTDPADPSTCTNPSITCTLERNGASMDCATSAGSVDGVDCSESTTEPPCTVHVRVDYQFRLILAIAPMPSSIEISRASSFRVSNLQAPSPAP